MNAQGYVCNCESCNPTTEQEVVEGRRNEQWTQAAIDEALLPTRQALGLVDALGNWIKKENQ